MSRQAAQAQAQAQAWQHQQAQQQAYYNNQAAQYTAAMGGEALHGLMASSCFIKVLCSIANGGSQMQGFKVMVMLHDVIG